MSQLSEWISHAKAELKDLVQEGRGQAFLLGAAIASALWFVFLP